MSDDRARARRMMRLSELHARARQWQEEPTQDDAAAEFERTGRLPEDFGSWPAIASGGTSCSVASHEPREAQAQAQLYSRFRVAHRIFLSVSYRLI